MSTHKIFEGFDKDTGIAETTHFEDGQIVIQKQFDAEPHLEYAKQAREATEGKRWGDGRFVGHLPPAVYGRISLIRDRQERSKAIHDFFRENPAYVMFEPYLKDVK